MRLTHTQIETIKSTAAAVLGEGVRVTLFGSRLDDHEKGGDVDLYIELPEPSLMQKNPLQGAVAGPTGHAGRSDCQTDRRYQPDQPDRQKGRRRPVSEHIALIWKKLEHLARMREYLLYSQ